MEVQAASGQVAFIVVGLGDKAVGESRERVRAAFAGLGLALPAKRLIVNLAPADLPKEGSHYDLPIALGLLAVMGVVAPDALSGWMAFGELGLDGRIAPTAGALPRRHGRLRPRPRPDLPGSVGRLRRPGAGETQILAPRFADRRDQPFPRDAGAERAPNRGRFSMAARSPTFAT